MDIIEKAAEKLKAPAQGAVPPELADLDPRRESRRVEIDFERLRVSGIVSPHSERSQIAEEFRLIKRPLLLRAFAEGPEAIHNGHLILVTSTQPGEGKTFCTVNLAMSIASERDLTVLLVDADVSNPRVLPTLGLSADRGLVDVLVDDSIDLADVLIRTNLENLSILPAGRQHHLTTELLASGRMEQFVQEIAQRYPDRVIIFDSPPTLSSSVPGVLALHMGQIVYVVEAERTTQAEVNSGLGMISTCKNIGLLLNKNRSRRGFQRYGAYYIDRP